MVVGQWAWWPLVKLVFQFCCPFQVATFVSPIEQHCPAVGILGRMEYTRATRLRSAFWILIHVIKSCCCWSHFRDLLQRLSCGWLTHWRVAYRSETLNTRNGLPVILSEAWKRDERPNLTLSLIWWFQFYPVVNNLCWFFVFITADWALLDSGALSIPAGRHTSYRLHTRVTFQRQNYP